MSQKSGGVLRAIALFKLVKAITLIALASAHFPSCATRMPSPPFVASCVKWDRSQSSAR
jgi:hypothetical protein